MHQQPWFKIFEEIVGEKKLFIPVSPPEKRTVNGMSMSREEVSFVRMIVVRIQFKRMLAWFKINLRRVKII